MATYIPQRNLWVLLGITDWDDSSDVEEIARKSYLIHADHRGKAEQLVVTWSFKEFIMVPASSKLLVHGDFYEGMHQISALSSVCWTLKNSLDGMAGFKTLVFFCGCHIDPGSNERTTGGQGLIRSLLAQLLRQYEFDTRVLHEQVNLDQVAAGDLEGLCHLFVWLACHLPQKTTLVCLIDGISYFERQEHAGGMNFVLCSLLDLTRDARMRGVFKILITSPVPTGIVRHHPAFQNGLDTVSIASFPKPDWGASSHRVARQLGEALGRE